jgi:hypothetical protein
VYAADVANICHKGHNKQNIMKDMIICMYENNHMQLRAKTLRIKKIDEADYGCVLDVNVREFKCRPVYNCIHQDVTCFGDVTVQFTDPTR